MDNRESSAKRGYGSRWQKARLSWLRDNPLCADHLKRGAVVPATVVDHIVPHRGDTELFWDRDNWQSLCKRCHDSHKQRTEKSGTAVGCDLSGIPLDPNHHWGGGKKAIDLAAPNRSLPSFRSGGKNGTPLFSKEGKEDES